MNNDITNIIGILNHQKGELMFLQTLMMAVLRSLPSQFLNDALRQFNAEVDLARDSLLNQNWLDVLDSFDKYVKILRELWPEWNDSNSI